MTTTTNSGQKRLFKVDTDSFFPFDRWEYGDKLLNNIDRAFEDHYEKNKN